MSSKRLYLVIALVVVLITVGVTTLALKKKAVAPAQEQNNTVYQGEKTTTEEPITITGEVICLTPKNTGEPVDMSCAIGLKQDDGKNYALSSEDPTVTGSLPTGQKVRVVGTFSKKTTQYNIEGVIKVSSLERL